MISPRCRTLVDRSESAFEYMLQHTYRSLAGCPCTGAPVLKTSESPEITADYSRMIRLLATDEVDDGDSYI